MFHGMQINDKINKLHKRALKIVYNDTVTSFEDFLIKDKSFTIHPQNIQFLAIEIYKAIHNLPGGNLRKMTITTILALNHNKKLGPSRGMEKCLT